MGRDTAALYNAYWKDYFSGDYVKIGDHSSHCFIMGDAIAGIGFDLDKVIIGDSVYLKVKDDNLPQEDIEDGGTLIDEFLNGLKIVERR